MIKGKFDTWLTRVLGGFVFAFFYAPLSFAEDLAGFIRPDTQTILIFDQEGRPGKWALTAAPKIRIVQRILEGFSDDLINRTDISLRRASTGKSGDASADCSVAEVDLALGAETSPGEIQEFINILAADGHQTAPSAALETAVSDLEELGGGRIVYFTDGVTSCHDDPLWIAEQSGPGVAIDVVAIGQANRLHTLAELALSSGGNFYLIEDRNDLAKLGGPMIDEVLQESAGSGRIELGEAPDGDMPAMTDEGDQSVSTNTTGPLFSGDRSGASLSRIDTGIENCPTFDLLSQNLLDYTKGIDPDLAKPVPDPVALAFILDASGSMAARQSGRTKMAIAKEALSVAVRETEGSNVLTSLWAYGFDTSVEKSAERSCPNTAEIVPFARNQSRKVARAANQLTAYGFTPLATSLTLAGESLQSVRATRRIAVLISDGEETCGGDPVAAAAQLAGAGVDISTYVVGYDLDADQRRQLEAVAKAGGTEYLDAADKNALANALKEVVKVAVGKTVRIAPSCENPVTGGLTPETATLLPHGIYTVGELLARGTYRYYRVETEEGERGVVRGLIQSRQYVDRDGDPKESAAAPTAMTIDMLYPDGSPTAAQSARGAGLPGTAFDATFVDTEGDGFIFGIGDNYRILSPDSLFEVSAIPFADGAVGDAGNDPKGGDFATIPIDGSATGHIGAEDFGDLWRYESRASGDVKLVISFDNEKFRSRISVFDETTGKRIARSSKGSINVAISGPIRVWIENRTPKTRPLYSRYTIEVTHD